MTADLHTSTPQGVAATDPVASGSARRTPLRVAELALAVFGLVAALLIGLDTPGPIRAIIVFAALIFVPGWAVLRSFPAIEPAARLVFTVTGSIVVLTLLSLAEVFTHLWAPRLVDVVVLVAGAVVIGRRPVAALAVAHSHTRVSPQRLFRRDRERWISFWPFAALLVALVLWIVGIALTNSTNLGQLGLLVALPGLWYLSLAIVFVVTLVALFTTRRSHGLLAAGLSLLTLILYATPTLVENAPRLPWVYKHIAVTNYVFANGSVNPNIDIYNRWPGLFSFSASLSSAIGLHDAVSYAGIAETFFALIDGFLVLAIARTISRHRRWAWTTAIVFTIGNWVGQNYYSPQAFAFMLYLAAALVVLMALGGEPRRPMAWIEKVIGGPARRFGRALNPEKLGVTQSRRARIVSIVALLGLQAVIVMTHQLTPYMAVLAFLPLFVLGYLRPFWVGIAIVVLPLAYLAPQIGYLQSHFGLFGSGSFDPVANASTASVSVVGVSAASELQSKGVQLLTGLAVLLAFAGFVRRILQGHVRTTLVVAWLAVAPAFTFFAQSYGGEGKFRVFLFGLPFYAMGVSWLFWTGKSRIRVRKVGLIASLSVLLLLFVGTYYQPEASLRVDRGDVKAALWMDARFSSNDTFISLADTFPSLIGPNYPKYLERYTQDYDIADLTTSVLPTGQKATITALEKFMYAGYSTVKGGKTWVAFSDAQEHTVLESGALTKAQISQIEDTVAAVSTLAYDKDGVRIYERTNL